MTDRPIVMTAESVRATLDGRKTQTRRVLKPQPVHAQHHTWHGRVVHDSEYRHFCWKGHVGADNWDPITKQIGPYLPYLPGDRLWVREAWQTPGYMSDPLELAGYRPDGLRLYVLYADGETSRTYYPGDAGYTRIRELVKSHDDECRKRSPRFMPRWASRLTLIVTDVKVERLQDISEDDAIAEGIFERHLVGDDPMTDSWGWRDSQYRYSHPLEAYRNLWNSINGKRAGCTWGDNPWVAAITYRHASMNIDALREAAE